MAPAVTRPYVFACVVTAASGLTLMKSVLTDDDDTSYPVFGAGFCSADEKDDGSRIGDWVNGQTKFVAEQACAADEACKGFNWNTEHMSYVLVSEVGGPVGDKTEKGEICYQKPEAEELNRVESDEQAQLTDDQQAIAQEQGAALDADILKMTTGKPDWRVAHMIKDLVAAHPKLPSIMIGSKSCFSNDGAHSLAELKDLKSLTIGDDNGIEAKMLTSLTKLTSLTIGKTNSLDAGIYMALGHLTDLTSLTIGGKNRFGLEKVCGSAKLKANGLRQRKAKDFWKVKVSRAKGSKFEEALMAAGETAEVEVDEPLPDDIGFGSIIIDELSQASSDLSNMTSAASASIVQHISAAWQDSETRFSETGLRRKPLSKEEAQHLLAKRARKPRDLIKEEKNAFKMAKELEHVGSLMIGTSNCIGVLGAKVLGQLSRLQSLHIGDKNSIGVDGAEALGSLTKLTNLTIGHGNAFGTKGFKALTKLAKLTSLTIGDKNSFGVDHDEDDEQRHGKFQAQCRKAHQEDEN